MMTSVRQEQVLAMPVQYLGKAQARYHVLNIKAHLVLMVQRPDASGPGQGALAFAALA